MRRRLGAIALAASAALLLAAAPSHAEAPLEVGFFDPIIARLDVPTQSATFAQAAQLGAGTVRLEATWSSIAPRRPADPTDPADPAYDFSRLDASVALLRADGIRPVIGVLSAPAWAEGAGRPASAPSGTWRPDPAALGAFGTALARRYPDVRAFAAWNEPNLDTYLSPQWVGSAPAAPAQYRSMLNAFYTGVKAVSPQALVVAGSTSPYGDLEPGGHRMQPARFVRELLCADGAGRPRRSCPDPAHFDVLDHHPYAVGGPTYRARNADDVNVPDLAKLSVPLQRAVAAGHALPRRAKRLWVTEVSWDSGPPDPQGVSPATQARWLQQTMQSLWAQGVDTVLWFLVRDQAPVPSFAATYQSGVFTLSGAPKPSATAFRFPFVVLGEGRRVWLRSPVTGTISVQRRVGTRWLTSTRVRAARGEVRTRALRGVGAGDLMRAVAPDGTASLAWRVTRK